MNSEDKFKIEWELSEYFTQFHDKGVEISLFKGKTEVPVKVDNNGNPNEIITKDNADGIYFVPPVENDVYNAELFETFYQLLLSNQKAPEPLFLKREFEFISEKYTNVVKKEYPILDYWIYFLEQKKDYFKPNPNCISEKNEFNTACWAYYYHILHTVEPNKRFENDSEGKVKCIERIANEKGISSKNFQQYYNILENKASERTNRGKVNTLKKVLEMFPDNHPGRKLAQEYLNKALENM
jgi:hypothetical protein